MTDEPPRQERNARQDAVLARVEGPVDGAPADAFLRRFAGLPRGFWERDGRWSAWAGTAARLAVPRGREAPVAEVRERAGSLFRRLAETSAGADAARTGAAGEADRSAGAGDDGRLPRLYGGFAFDPARRPDVPRAAASPADLPGGLFVLPAVELRGDGGEARLAVAVASPEGTEPAEARAAAGRTMERVRAVLEDLARAGRGGDAGGAAGRGDDARDGAGGEPRPSVREVRRTPEREGWRRLVEAALEEVAAGRLEKVVPARGLDLVLAGPADGVAVLEALRDGGPGTFPYLLEPVGGTFLAGAAPEIVAAREGDRFHATAVAGTVREGADPAESERLARRLLSSDKDRREHEIGVRDMREALLEAAGVVEVDEAPRVLRLQGMQHLLTNLSARVSDGLHVLDLLATLHPTAAVNGRPRDAALAFLRSREPFDRGWYAGPVGWFDAAGDGIFVPALRAVAAAERRVRVCAGAGIVEGSRPGPEWDETGVKLRPALRALGLEGAAADRAVGADAAAAAGAREAEVAPAADAGG